MKEANKLNNDDSWKILIIDDDKFVHVMIREELKDFTFEGKPLQIIDAYTGAEALKILSRNTDIALILLDIYLGDETTGLELSKYIREVIGNSLVRIIIMTSSNNNTLQKDAILNYDINGYEEKTELLSRKLHTVITSTLRYYRDILHIATNKKAMEEIVASSSKICSTNSLKDFLSSTFYHLNSIINFYKEDDIYNVNGLAAIRSQKRDEFYIVSGYGKYTYSTDEKLLDIVDNKDLQLIKNVYYNKKYIISDGKYLSCYRCSSGVDAIIIFDINPRKKRYIDHELLNVLHNNITATFESLCINKEIEETQKEILYILGEVTEARSEETGNHVQRVSKYVKILAEKYGLSERDVTLATTASPIHDIGKVAIPDKILLKPGKLTPEEFEVIKEHTTIGYNILKNSSRDVLKTAAVIAHEHHERYDGNWLSKRTKRRRDTYIWKNNCCSRCI